MAENVSTGGLMTFNYNKQQTPELDPNDKKEINNAYDDYYKRKHQESKRKRTIILAIIIAAIIIIGGLIAYFLLK